MKKLFPLLLFLYVSAACSPNRSIDIPIPANPDDVGEPCAPDDCVCLESCTPTSPKHTCHVEETCFNMDFDSDSSLENISPGQEVSEAYLGYGVRLEHRGMAVAFDTNNPTGGDYDLTYTDRGNVLISQERYSYTEWVNGFVNTPDDSACGALFKFYFDHVMCLRSIALLDIEEGAKLVMTGYSEEYTSTNNGQLLVEANTCGEYLYVKLRGSGAVDDIVLCYNETVCD